MLAKLRESPHIAPAVFFTGVGVGHVVSVGPPLWGLAFLALGVVWFSYAVIDCWRAPAARSPYFYACTVTIVGAVYTSWLWYFDPNWTRAAIIEATNVVARNGVTCKDLGRKDALEFLAANGQDLTGKEFDCAYLEGLTLPPGTKARYLEWAGGKGQGAVLVGVEIGGSKLSETDFTGADFSDGILDNAIFGAHWLRNEKTDRARCYRGAIMNEAKLDGADLRAAWLVGVRGLTCKQLKRAKNWENSVRDESLSCGATIPELRQYLYTKKWPQTCE